MKKTPFSLVELLVVIIIISILLTVGGVGANAVFSSVKVATAKQTIAAVVAAAESYNATYGYYPWTKGKEEVLDCNGTDDLNEKGNSDIENYRLLFSILAAGDYNDKSYTSDKKYKNTRKQRFWEPPSNFGTKDYEMRDPWGNFYVFYVDADGDYRANALPGIERFTMWSYGPLGEESATNRQQMRKDFDNWCKQNELGKHIWNGRDGIICSGHDQREEEDE